MRITHPEALQHTSAGTPSPRNHLSHSSTSFAQTLENMRTCLAEGEQLCADQARMAIRIMGATMTGDFHQVSGWSGEDAEVFFSSFNALRTYSGTEHPSAPATASHRTQHASRAYAQMASGTGQEQPEAAKSDLKHPHSAADHPPATASSTAAAYPDDLHRLIDNVAQNMGLPSRLVHSVVLAESSYRPDAVSPAGAQGLMQLMPTTAQEVGVKNSFDPQENLTGGCRYLKGLLDKYDGDLDHALAAYNWGQGNVDRKGLEQMPLETRNYIARVKQELAQQA